MKITLRMTVDVTFDTGSVPVDVLKTAMEHVIHHGMQAGLFTSDSDAEVVGCAVSVKQVAH